MWPSGLVSKSVAAFQDEGFGGSPWSWYIDGGNLRLAIAQEPNWEDYFFPHFTFVNLVSEGGDSGTGSARLVWCSEDSDQPHVPWCLACFPPEVLPVASFCQFFTHSQWVWEQGNRQVVKKHFGLVKKCGGRKTGGGTKRHVTQDRDL